MATKGDISKALARNLTGIEAARLILQDSMEVDHGRDGFLSDKDIQHIKNNLSSSEADVYNRYIDAYRAIDYTLKEAHISCLEIIIKIHEVRPIIMAYYDEWRLKYLGRLMPVIVTQKQYDDLEAAQKKYKLKDLYSASSVLDRRLEARAPEAWETWENAEEDIPSEAFFIEKYPEVWREALEDVIEAIEAGRLRPVLLKPKDLVGLERLDRERFIATGAFSIAVASLTGHEEPKEDPRWLALETYKEQKASEGVSLESMKEVQKQASKDLDDLHKETETLRQKAHKAGLARWSKSQADKVVSILRRIAAGSLSTEDGAGYELLSGAYCSGQDLYNTGWPEQIAQIDTFWPGYTGENGEEESFGAEVSGYAVLQEPAMHRLDKRGYYKSNLLELLSPLRRLEEAYAEDGSNIKTDLQNVHRLIRARLRDILATQSTIQMVSEVIDINFSEDMDRWIGDVTEVVEKYNSLLKIGNTSLMDDPIPKDFKLPALKIDDLKPSKQYLQYLKERLAMSLGQDWSRVWAEETDKLQKQVMEEEGWEIVSSTRRGGTYVRWKSEGAEDDN